MEQITVRARAKINPFLEVLYKRPDGYHELYGVMQTLRLYDTVLIKKVNKYPFRFICEPERLPVDERNLVCRAARYMIEKYNIEPGIFIKLTKRIPVSAGLGGGSSDGAATLLGMNKLFNLNIPSDELMEIAGTFGADVPFCMMGGTVLAEGIGERCTRLPHHPPCWVVLAKPPGAVSTSVVFDKWTQPGSSGSSQKSEPFLQAIRAGDINGIAKGFFNSLLPVTVQMHPEIVDLITILKNNGALNASMSGSGPTVFGYFVSKSAAAGAITAVKKEYPSIRELYLTYIYNPL